MGFSSILLLLAPSLQGLFCAIFSLIAAYFAAIRPFFRRKAQLGPKTGQFLPQQAKIQAGQKQGPKQAAQLEQEQGAKR